MEEKTVKFAVNVSMVLSVYELTQRHERF